MPTLAELITERKDHSGLSYEELAAKSQHVLTRQRFQQLGKGLRITEFPEPATLAAIAESIEVDVAVVVLATAKSIGLSVDMGADSELAMMLPAAARDLTRDQRNALLALVRSIVTEDTNEQSLDQPEADARLAAHHAVAKQAARSNGRVNETDHGLQ